VLESGAIGADGLYIAMELLEGRSLAHELRRGALHQDRALHIAQQICRSLREAHAHGVVHRDLKPGSVFLLSSDDDQDFVKVLGFGLVRKAGDPGEGAHAAHATLAGTPQYMAPEQARDDAPDQRADIYALGVLLFEMLTGRVPFDGPSAVDVLVKTVRDAPPRPRTVRPDLPIAPELDELVLRCLAKGREDRPPSMDELLRELRHIRLASSGWAGPDTGSFQIAQLQRPGAVTPATATPVMIPIVSGAPAARPGVARRIAAAVALALAAAIAIGLARAGIRAAAVGPPRSERAQVMHPSPPAMPASPTATPRQVIPPSPPVMQPSPAAAPPSPSVMPSSPTAPPSAAPRAADEPEKSVPALVLTADALRMPPPDPGQLAAAGLRAPKKTALRVCVGPDGKVVSAEPLQPAPESPAVAAHLRATWSFRTSPMRRCAVITLLLSPP
jgi:serine/threonine-protein kinase